MMYAADEHAFPGDSRAHGSRVNLVTMTARAISRVIGAILVALIGFYRLAVSPLLGPSCRFHPSCSAYAVEAIRRHGPLHGTRQAHLRLARCNPLCEGGYDPVR